MLEYPIAGAEQLLCCNLAQAESSLRQVDEDMDHIRDQCTTLEVGILPVTLHLSQPQAPVVCVNLDHRKFRHGAGVQLGCERETEEEGNCIYMNILIKFPLNVH